jgi:phage-related protein
MAEWFAGLSDKTKENIAIMLTVVAALAPVILIIGKLTSVMGSLIGGIGGLSKALTFLTAHPIIAAIAAIVGIMVLLYTTNEKVRESINNIVSTIGTALAPILQMLGNLFNEIIQVIQPLITMIGDLLVPILDMIGPLITPLIELLQAALVPVMAILSNNIKVFMAILTPVIKLLQMVLVPVMSIIQKSIGFITQLMQPLKNALMGLAPVFNFIFNLFQTGLALVEKGIQFVLKGIENVINSGIDMINHLIRAINSLGGWLGISLKELDYIRINIESGATTEPSATPQIETPAGTAQTALDGAYSQGISNSYNTTTNNDYSNKEVSINVTVQNYAEQVYVDEMVRQINIKLAEAM